VICVETLLRLLVQILIFGTILAMIEPSLPSWRLSYCAAAREDRQWLVNVQTLCLVSHLERGYIVLILPPQGARHGDDAKRWRTRMIIIMLSCSATWLPR
jgi:hypothetical protein